MKPNAAREKYLRAAFFAEAASPALFVRAHQLRTAGYRDYDPGTGRFTCPDPLGDTGGDHDLYDYCVDDPVSMNDPEGLFPPALYGLALMGVRLLPHLPRLVNAAMIRGHAMIQASRYAKPINIAAEVAEGLLNPNPSMGVAAPKVVGSLASAIKNKLDE